MNDTSPRVPEHPVDPRFVERWSPRAFTDEAIDDATLMTLFEAARWAPSGSNLQPWRFVYARRDTPSWPALLGGLAESNRVWARHAAALVAVLSRTRHRPEGQAHDRPIASHSFDAGAAWMSLALQAMHSGWHTHAMGGIDRDALRAALGVPDDHAIEAVVAIGRRGDEARLPETLRGRERPSARRPLSQTVAEGRFSF